MTGENYEVNSCFFLEMFTKCANKTLMPYYVTIKVSKGIIIKTHHGR